MHKNNSSKSKSNPSRYDHANFYASEDIDVFPLPRGRKYPPPTGWQSLARKTPRALKQWFDDSDANIGVRTGDGFVVLDIDITGGRDGIRSLHKLENEVAQTLPSTLTVRTASGGLHYYFFYDPEKYDVRNSVDKLGKGIDVRGEGGFVVGIGSTTAKGAYTLELDAPIADAPIWFLQRVTRQVAHIDAPVGKTRRISAQDRDAIMSLPSDNYDDWYQAGMACKESFGDAGFGLWTEWSAKSAKYKGIEDCADKWRTFSTGDAGAITFGSIIHRAKENGWTAQDTLAKNVGKISEAIAAGEAMDPSERRLWLASKMPSISRANLPELKYTQAGEVSSIALSSVVNVDAALQFMNVAAVYNAYTHECEIEYTEDELQEVLKQFDEPQAMLRALSWGIGMQVGFGKRNEWDEAVNVLATDEKYHPIADWISSEPWDGVDRLADLANTVSLDDTSPEMFITYLRRWFIQGIQACFGWDAPQQHRGCLVLSGPQTCGKTTWFGSLVPEGAYKAGVALNQFGGSISTDSVKLATSAFITELGELETTFSRADTGALKNFLTATWDEYRVPYGRQAVKHPRTTIFCGTVNHREFLRDSTGSSRFWPVGVRRCNAFHDVAMQQVWAQALSLWEGGETWFLTAEEDAARVADEERFTERTPQLDALQDHWDLYAGAPTEKWISVGLDKALDYFGFGVSLVSRRDMRDALEKVTGMPARKLRGEKRRWMIPDRYIPKEGDGGDT